jgi:hypothetical protein
MASQRGSGTQKAVAVQLIPMERTPARGAPKMDRSSGEWTKGLAPTSPEPAVAPLPMADCRGKKCAGQLSVPRETRDAVWVWVDRDAWEDVRRVVQREGRTDPPWGGEITSSYPFPSPLHGTLSDGCFPAARRVAAVMRLTWLRETNYNGWKMRTIRYCRGSIRRRAVAARGPQVRGRRLLLFPAFRVLG